VSQFGTADIGGIWAIMWKTVECLQVRTMALILLAPVGLLLPKHWLDQSSKIDDLILSKLQ
jgi:hypothetical protein